MVQWSIKTEQERHAEGIATHGEVEYENRLQIANKKADELKDWKEQMFLRPQFEAIALAAKPETIAKLATATGRKWAQLFYKLAHK